MKSKAGIAETKYYNFARPPGEMVLESGKKLGPVTIVYETYGRLNKNKNNAILVLHALSGDAHAAGSYKGDKRPGWWDDMIGPGKAFDTTKYFILCSNVIGGCRGSTGPSSINEKTGKPYGLDFPIITIADMINAQKYLIDYLEIEKLLCVVGGSMGGMQVIQWVASYPDRILSAIPIATALKHSPQQIAFNEVGRQAIISDPAWQEGNYYGKDKPERGLALARMIGHITYMSDESMEKKFSRKLKNGKDEKNGRNGKNSNYNFSFTPEFEVEGYLHYRGDNFVKRFDANSYLYMTKPIDYFDLSDGDKLIPQGSKPDIKFLVISFKSDWLYPSYQSREIVKILKAKHLDVTYCEINSNYGHDAFLLEFEEETRLVKHFLKRVYNYAG